jgi:hypothetical protein
VSCAGEIAIEASVCDAGTPELLVLGAEPLVLGAELLVLGAGPLVFGPGLLLVDDPPPHPMATTRGRMLKATAKRQLLNIILVYLTEAQ